MEYEEDENQMIQQLTLDSRREHNPYTDCRMYENEFPEVDDLVMVRVTRVTEIGAYVNMLEYNNKVSRERRGDDEGIGSRMDVGF
jgi:exosome complex RNA-binding protein Csl4